MLSSVSAKHLKHVRGLEQCQEKRDPEKQFVPTIVVVALDDFGGLIQPVLVEFPLGQLVPEARIQGAAEGSELQLGERGPAGIPARSGHGWAAERCCAEPCGGDSGE